MSQRHPEPGATGSPAHHPTARPPTLDFLLENLPASARLAFLPARLPRRAAPPSFDWLAVDPVDLPAFHPVPNSHPEAAVALGSPDLFLVAVPPGLVRDHTLRAVVNGAVGLGERVLVLAPSPAEADRLTEWLPSAVRALAATEHVDDLLPAVAERTSTAHGLDRVAEARRALAASVRSAEAQLAPAVDAERTARQADLAVLREQLKALDQLSAARKSGRVLSRLFWRAVLAGDVGSRKAELERQARKLGDWIERSAADRLHAETVLAMARRCLAGLADEAAAVGRFLARAYVVVAPPGAAADPAVAAGFDRLVVAAAEAHPEADVRAASRVARRGVLLGTRDAGPAGNGYTYAATALPGGLFSRLWDRLHQPIWAVAGGRLVCRLTNTVSEPLACEPCADRPEVELRFGTGADGGPVVAEIAFPMAGPEGAADAKAFLARELGEVRLNPCGVPRWAEADGRIAAEWPTASGCVWAEVGPGVLESIAMIDGVPVTARVAFDPAAGWDRPAAERWVERHTAAARAARTARVHATAIPEPEPCLV